MMNFDGYKNYETREMTLEIENTYELYTIARSCKNYKELIKKLHLAGKYSMFDGTKYDDEKIDQKQVNEWLADLNN